MGNVEVNAVFLFSLSLRTFSCREPSGRLSVNLYDTSGPEDVDINQALVDAGWAIKVDPDQNSQSQAQDSVSPSSNQTDSISMAPA